MHDRKKDPFLVWFQELSDEVTILFHDLFLFRTTRDLIDLFVKPYCKDFTYTDWIRRSATDSLVIRVGRLCDPDMGTRSFVAFLNALKTKENRYLSRAKHLEMFDDKTHAGKRFEEFGGNKSGFPIAKINADIKKLIHEGPCRKIIKYRNEYIAHRAKIQSGPPTYNELFEATKIVSSILKVYELLLLGRMITKRTPTIQGDWTRALRVPWLPEGSAVFPAEQD